MAARGDVWSPAQVSGRPAAALVASVGERISPQVPSLRRATEEGMNLATRAAAGSLTADGRPAATRFQRRPATRSFSGDPAAVVAAVPIKVPGASSPLERGQQIGVAVRIDPQHDRRFDLVRHETARKGARQRSTLDEIFTGVTEYHPISHQEEP